MEQTNPILESPNGTFPILPWNCVSHSFPWLWYLVITDANLTSLGVVYISLTVLETWSAEESMPDQHFGTECHQISSTKTGPSFSKVTQSVHATAVTYINLQGGTRCQFALGEASLILLSYLHFSTRPSTSLEWPGGLPKLPTPIPKVIVPAPRDISKSFFKGEENQMWASWP